ncbi:hypothetical protein [Priestia megaterium]|uniref:hypothetical protein n=1 Tax=Priestia megaterium TaxID=1404 RepID=UPI002E222D36|nr:hypothetical protein [Priestia megaterium]
MSAMIHMEQTEKVVKVDTPVLDKDFAKELAVALLQGEGIKVIDYCRSQEPHHFYHYGLHETHCSPIPISEKHEVTLQLPNGIKLTVERESYK